jgi:hypothetical protein
MRWLSWLRRWPWLRGQRLRRLQRLRKLQSLPLRRWHWLWRCCAGGMHRVLRIMGQLPLLLENSAP